MLGFLVIAFVMTAVAHHGCDIPPSVVQLVNSTPLYQKGNWHSCGPSAHFRVMLLPFQVTVSVRPAYVRHPAILKFKDKEIQRVYISALRVLHILLCLVVTCLASFQILLDYCDKWRGIYLTRDVGVSSSDPLVSTERKPCLVVDVDVWSDEDKDRDVEFCR